MTTDQQSQFLSIAEEYGITAEAYPDYSGRGMFGAKTPAVEVESAEIAWAIAGIMSERNRDRDGWGIVKFRVDQLGGGWIVY